MNKIWGWMLLVGIGVGLATGKSADISAALIESSKNGVNYAIGMAGVVAHLPCLDFLYDVVLHS